MRSAATSPRVALMGLRVDRTKVSVYVISGFCAGIAGLLFSFYTASGDPVAGIGYELNAIAAVVIGGTLLSGGSGYVFGSMLGVLVLGDDLRLQGVRRRSEYRVDPHDDRRTGACSSSSCSGSSPPGDGLDRLRTVAARGADAHRGANRGANPVRIALMTVVVQLLDPRPHA